MNKIYLVSCYFAPLGRANANRAFLVKCLCNAGMEVEVIAGENYKSFILSFQEDHSLLKDIPPQVKIHRFNGRPGWLTYDLKKLFGTSNNLRTHWINSAEKNMPISGKGIIYAIVPQHDNAVLAYKLACKYDCPLVLHYADDVLYVDPKIVKRADLLVAVTQQIKQTLYDHYGHTNIMIVENGHPDSVEIPEKNEISFPIKIAYAGSMTMRTHPCIVAKAYQKLWRKNRDIAKNLMFDFYAPPGGYYNFLFLNRYLGGNIQFKGFLPYHDLMPVLTHYDLGLASSCGENALVSKVYHYINCGLPVLGVYERSGMSEFIEENQIGLHANRDVNAIMDQLINLVENKDQILSWRKNVIKIKPKYSLKNYVEKLAKQLKAL